MMPCRSKKAISTQAVIEKHLIENSSARSVSASIAGALQWVSHVMRSSQQAASLQARNFDASIMVDFMRLHTHPGTHRQLQDILEKAHVHAAIILGGGAGSRLYPLTKQRAKPAVPIGGAYRLIDVPMSNCINSGISKIYILTQFNSTSLNRHLAR